MAVCLQQVNFQNIGAVPISLKKKKKWGEGWGSSCTIMLQGQKSKFGFISLSFTCANATGEEVCCQNISFVLLFVLCCTFLSLNVIIFSPSG